MQKYDVDSVAVHVSWAVVAVSILRPRTCKKVGRMAHGDSFFWRVGNTYLRRCWVQGHLHCMHMWV